MKDVDNKIKMIVEGLLLAAGKPLNLDVIASVFSEDERPDKAELKDVLDSIALDCRDRGFELQEVASGFRFQVRQDLSQWIAKLWEERPPRYTRALLETLALVAYRQPITRGDIEEIRGVAVSPNIIRTLLDREWIRVVGHKDVPGKPALFATTRQFLDYFNLKSIQQLPPLSEVKQIAGIDDDFNSDDVVSTGKVLELPNEDQEAEIYATILGDLPAEGLLEEEAAVALSKKPLDEILGLDKDDDTQESDSGEEEWESEEMENDGNSDSEERGVDSEELSGISDTLQLREAADSDGGNIIAESVDVEADEDLSSGGSRKASASS